MPDATNPVVEQYRRNLSEEVGYLRARALVAFDFAADDIDAARRAGEVAALTTALELIGPGDLPDRHLNGGSCENSASSD